MASSRAAVRVLEWDGCANVRDLGGHALADGAVTSYGAFVRADSLRNLTPVGWQALVEYGVVRVVDLRWHEELALDDPYDVPVEVVHVPLFGDSPDPEYGRYLDERLDATESTDEYFRWSYLDFLGRHRANFGAAMNALADAEGTAVVHCMAGKDRTGLVAALLLRLAGVDVEQVAHDYAATDIARLPVHRAWIAAARDGAEAARRERLSATPYDAMVGVLTGIEERHGTVADYLRAAGVTTERLEELRRRLRPVP
ncbi:MAG: tyrosine-protein phosphatase [Gaiella sp.]